MGTGHLILDVGNTRCKAALFRGGVLRRWAVLPAGDAAAVAGFLHGEVPAAIGIGSVAADRPALMAQLAAIAPVLVLTGASPTPFATRVRDRAAL
ncbi:MAG: hypothetical protein RBT71_14325, partial [Flavobacteriales bacterium]|nr:hypothetical protein [Flavobacteriales bacterium]